MVRPYSPARTFAALLLLAVAAGVLASLGRWQLHRADERRAIRAQIEAGRAQPPIALAPGTPAAELRPWRPAQARGTWLHELTVLVDRNQEGRPGQWVATPLLLDGSRTAVLVLRGWIPRAMPGQPAAPLPRPGGEQTVTGELADRVPRLFELWSFGGKDVAQLPDRLPAGDSPPEVQNLDLQAYARATGLNLLPAVLEQTGPDTAGLKGEWPQPSIDSDQNMGYAMQWFGFTGIAVVAWLVVAWRAWRRRK